MTARKKMAELVREQNAQERHREWDAREEKPGFDEGVEIIGKEPVQSRGRISRVSGGKLCAGRKSRECSNREKANGYDERTKRTRLRYPNKLASRHPRSWFGCDQFCGKRFGFVLHTDMSWMQPEGTRCAGN